jgi:hypothetical protein
MRQCPAPYDYTIITCADPFLHVGASISHQHVALVERDRPLSQHFFDNVSDSHPSVRFLEPAHTEEEVLPFPAGTDPMCFKDITQIYEVMSGVMGQSPASLGMPSIMRQCSEL